VIVGTDGSARLFDFGIAKAAVRIQTTRDGSVKGKLHYMAPEQLKREPIDRRADIFAASVVLWELLTGRRLFDAESEAQVLAAVLCGSIEPPSAFRADVLPELDAVVMRGLERQRDKRFATAAEMVEALDRAVECAEAEVVSQVLKAFSADSLARRAALVARAEQSADVPEVAVSSERETVDSRGGAGFSRRWLAATLVGVAIFAAFGLAFAYRAVRAPASAPIEASTGVTSPPPPPEIAPSTATPIAAEPAPVASVVSRPSLRVRTVTPVKKASPAAHPCAAVIVDDAGIRRYNRDCMH
jgi:serine/threonine-protein kinase